MIVKPQKPGESGRFTDHQAANTVTGKSMSFTDTSTRRRKTPLTVYASAAFMVLLAGGYLNEFIPRTLLSIYLVMSLLCYAAYALDKQAAVAGRRRIAESNLHLLALFGGWPGARIAQHRFRHKTQKVTFRRLFWVTVGLNLAVLAWLMTPEGSSLLSSLLTELYRALP